MPKVAGLGHVGLYVRDVDTMVDFYASFLGMTKTDQAPDGWITFLSARPEDEHHELALVRSAEQSSMLQQVSFYVDSLTTLKSFWQGIKERGYQVDRVINHGNAIGCYFRDPESNRVEVYWKTGKDYPQPHGDSIDLDLPEEAIHEALAAMPAKA